MNKKTPRIILFGPQGCGKGTQGQLLAERFDIPMIGVGEMFRHEIAEGTSLGKILQGYVDNGLLAPDDVVNAVVANGLKKHDLSKGFILDGYPRNVEQATYLDRIQKINLAIYLRITDAEAVRRLTGRRQCPLCKAIYHVEDAPPVKTDTCSVCGTKLRPRSDDNEEAIRKRLATFHFMTEPIASFYRQRAVLLVVNGAQPISYVFDELTRKIAKLGLG